MKVKELLEALQNSNPEADVVYADIENGPMRTFDIFEVWTLDKADDPDKSMVALIG